jgi:hypothetical protein
MRRERQEAVRREEEDAYGANQARLIKAAGRIPLLKSIDEVVAHASEVREVMSSTARLSFPALQISRRLSTERVFVALPQNNGRTPNVQARRTDQPSVGAHFDHYFADFSPWTLHENVSGTGIIRATFLSGKQFSAYRALAESLPNTDEADELLAATRASMGAIALNTAHNSRVFEGIIEPGTRTLIWHGTSNRGTPPAVHDIRRDEPGEYVLYAHQYRGDLAEGFEQLTQQS